MTRHIVMMAMDGVWTVEEGWMDALDWIDWDRPGQARMGLDSRPAGSSSCHVPKL